MNIREREACAYCACEQLQRRITSMTDLFRITHRTARGVYAGPSEKKIYESKQEFVQALLAVQSEIWAYSRAGFTSWIERAFRKKRRDADLGGHQDTRASRLVAVEQFIDGEWREVQWSFEPARLTINGVSYSDER